MRSRKANLLAAFLIPGLILGLLLFRWPGGLEFRSDDYLAIQYVQDWERVAQDFVGPQYDIPRLALFYRPLITLSIAIDARLGGNEAFLPLLFNLLVHVANAGLLFLLLRRYLGSMTAFCAAAWWAWQSGHLEAISWMVGRVDTHTSFFYLLALELDLRYREGRLRQLWPALLAFLLACMSKELALTLPGALFLLWLPQPSPRASPRASPQASPQASSPSWQQGLRRSLARLFPYSIVLLLVLISRWVFLGEAIGGYAIASPDFAKALFFWRPFLPRGEAAILSASGMLFGALSLAALLLLLWHGRKRLRALPLLLALSVILSLPSAGARGDGGGQRYDYLPSTSMAGLLALGGPLPPLLMLGADLLTGIPERQQLHEVCAQVRRYRTEAAARMAEPQTDLACFIDAPLMIDGRIAFNVGTDRLGLPPFGDSRVPVLPRRAVDASLATQRKPPLIGKQEPDYRGPGLLDLDRLGKINRRELDASFGLENLKPRHYGVLAAGSQGWLRVLVPARADGRLDLRDLLLAPLDGSRNQAPLIKHLWPSVETSVDPRPLLYLEAYGDQDQLLGSSSRGIFLPLDRGIGIGLEAKRESLWLILGMLAVTLALVPFWRSWRSNPGSRDRETSASAEAS